MHILKTLLFAALALNAVLARSATTDACLIVFEKAEQEKASIPTHAAGRRVAGPGRLYFHTAPDKRCETKNVFVIPNDHLEADADYGEFTHVIYWHRNADAGTAGWVLSSHLTETGMTIGLRPDQP